MKNRYLQNVACASTLVISAISILNIVATSSAIAQNISTEYGMICSRSDDARKIFIITNVFTIPSEGKDPYQLAPIYAPKFHEFIKSEGLLPSNGDCNAFRLENMQAQEKFTLEYVARMKGLGLKIIEIKGWHPNKPHGLTYVASSGAMPATKLPPPAKSNKNESIIVRDVGQPAAGKPAGEPAAKPVAAAKPVPKPAAKPAPKKPTKPCGRKGQRKCDRPSAMLQKVLPQLV